MQCGTKTLSAKAPEPAEYLFIEQTDEVAAQSAMLKYNSVPDQLAKKEKQWLDDALSFDLSQDAMLEMT